MGYILDELAKKNYPVLPSNLETGICFEFTLEGPEDTNALQWLSKRYLDADLVWSNREFIAPNDNDGSLDEEEAPYPRTYKIDAAALLLASMSNDGGLGMMGNVNIRARLYEIITLAYHAEHTILEEIYATEAEGKEE